MTTHPLIFEGDELEINYSTSAAGSVRVEIQDWEGGFLSGYGLDDCRSLTGDEINGVVVWNGGTSVASLSGKLVRLRFVMKDADVYSIRFRHVHV